MSRLLPAFSLLSVLFCGAIFGFFYAWICSTMWGLDATDPEVAITAMQAMNASVRNAVFAPAFFGTPVVLIMTAALAWASARRGSALAFAAAALIYLGGAFAVTALMNVPMNQALAEVQVGQISGAAIQIWRDYSEPWQFWNGVRTIASGISLLFAGYALLRLDLAYTVWEKDR